MIRIPTQERPHWRKQADEYGFRFHTMYGQAYWDETAYYQFTLQQIEQQIEDPSAELHQMCLQAVDLVVSDEYWLNKFQIPEAFWQSTADAWRDQTPSLYSRLDLVFHKDKPVKLLENNADTPTSLYESGFWQWLWLEDMVNSGKISKSADQFNSLQEKLIAQLQVIQHWYKADTLHFACCQDTEEDRGTVQYLQDCARAGNINNRFLFIEDIGLADTGYFTDLEDNAIALLFKLYPWEFMMQEEFGSAIIESPTQWIEPMWKAILSNKALLPLLWKMFPNHPNLLPAWFEEDLASASESKLVKKPLFSREGANISVLENGEVQHCVDGPYGEEGFIYQSWYPLPKFGDNHTLIGSWLVDDQPAGISIREDTQPITQDLSRYLPHIIL